jgi:hypothetical protein
MKETVVRWQRGRPALARRYLIASRRRIRPGDVEQLRAAPSSGAILF